MNAQLTNAANSNVTIALAVFLALAPLSADASTTTLDFDDRERGEFITTEYTASLGVTITGFGGANWGARIFDTNIPTGNWVTSNPLYDPSDPNFGDLDLGSPHQDFGGPGVGAGGGTGQPGANAIPLGNILIIDENGPEFPPDDQEVGGTIIASFASPQRLVGMGFLSVDGVDIDVYYDNFNALLTLTNPGAGKNGYFEITLNQDDVTEVWFKFNGGGGLAYIEYGLVPEPATGGMVLFGMGALAMRRRRA